MAKTIRGSCSRRVWDVMAARIALNGPGASHASARSNTRQMRLRLGSSSPFWPHWGTGQGRGLLVSRRRSMVRTSDVSGVGRGSESVVAQEGEEEEEEERL